MNAHLRNVSRTRYPMKWPMRLSACWISQERYPNKELDAVDRLVYDEQLNAFRNQLSSEDATKLERLLAGECFRGRKKMIRELKFWMVDFDPYNEDD